MKIAAPPPLGLGVAPIKKTLAVRGNGRGPNSDVGDQVRELMNGVRDSRYYFKWGIRREPPERLSYSKLP